MAESEEELKSLLMKVKEESEKVGLSSTFSQSLLELMSIELVMPSNHLILCCPLLLLPSIFPSIRVFSAIRVASCAYLKLSMFLPAILIPACASSRLVFHMMYTAYKLNKQHDYIQP